MIKFCKFCGEQIPEGRLKALPKTDTCTKCSNTEKKAGFQVITGKNTYTELDIVSQDTFKKLTYQQARKGQSPGNGIKN